MIKYFFLLIISSIVFAGQDNTLDPKALETMVAACKQIAQNDDYCVELRQKAKRLNRFAYELRVNPLQYGKKVLALQENLNDPLAKKQLKERLSIIKWLEAPER
jgi:hypothetical protein